MHFDSRSDQLARRLAEMLREVQSLPAGSPERLEAAEDYIALRDETAGL